jgi:hypothetical protein
MSLKRLSMPVESAILPVESTDSTFTMLELSGAILNHPFLGKRRGIRPRTLYLSTSF